jgi:methionine-S-sulfoxide reductase
MIKKAYLAGGCFWGLEDLVREQMGVIDTEVGYTGGSNDNPDYRNHPGHAEGLEITYDDTKTSYKKLLDYFFRVHDPTTLDRQGNDVGSAYRSAIFYKDESERKSLSQEIGIIRLLQLLSHLQNSGQQNPTTKITCKKTPEAIHVIMYGRLVVIWNPIIRSSYVKDYNLQHSDVRILQNA